MNFLHAGARAPSSAPGFFTARQPAFLPASALAAFATLATIAATLFFAAPAQAQEVQQLWNDVRDSVSAKVSDISNNGDNAIYVSGWAHHGRSTYSHEKLDELNEHAWGLGYGKTLRNEAGNDESLFGFVIRDSHKHPQIMAGYAYEWVWNVAGPIEVGLGGTAMLMSRQDYFSGVPFPVPLPLASIGTKQAKLMFSYVPRFSANKNNGDVLLVFGRVEF